MAHAAPRGGRGRRRLLPGLQEPAGAWCGMMCNVGGRLSNYKSFFFFFGGGVNHEKYTD